MEGNEIYILIIRGAKNNPPGSSVASALLSEAGGVSGEGSPRSGNRQLTPWLTPAHLAHPGAHPARAARLTRQNRTGNEAQVSLSPTVSKLITSIHLDANRPTTSPLSSHLLPLPHLSTLSFSALLPI
jgi:hypothetical protein